MTTYKKEEIIEKFDKYLINVNVDIIEENYGYSIVIDYKKTFYSKCRLELDFIKDDGYIQCISIELVEQLAYEMFYRREKNNNE